VHFQKIFNAHLSASRQNSQKTPKHVETYSAGWGSRRLYESEFQVDRPATAEHRRPELFRV